MHDDLDDELLAGYLAGTATEEERRAVEAWVSSDPARAADLHRLRRLWEAAGKRPIQFDPYPFLEKAVRDLSLDLSGRRTAAARSHRASDRAPSAAGSRKRVLLRLSLPALVLAVLSGMYLFLLHGGATDTVYLAGRGERVQFSLPDGTHAHLNAGSRMVVAADYGRGRRKVSLEGEAFFEVVHDPAAPFVVEASPGSVEVLGTSFSVTAYPGDPGRVAVLEGLVSVRLPERARSDTVILRARDVLLLSDAGAQLERTSVDPERHFGWTHGKLVFQETPFDEVVRSLERWYDLDIAVTVPAGGIDRLTASFSGEPVDEVLDVVSAVLNLKYSREQRSIQFYR